MASCFIYLVRHGVAADQGPEFPNDEDRPLTAEGIERMRAQDVRLDRVLTSPLVRAVQTAEILASGLECAAPLVTVEALRPGGRYDAVLAALGRLGADRSVALVGHMPSIGELAARLIGARAPLAFKKGGVCCIEADALPPAGPGELRWFVPPRALRALGRR
jgi:phosphohistidine phosphatase